jgi:spore germination cell wall hydrolase CwlJ-like protein
MKAESLADWRKLRQRRRLIAAAIGLGVVAAIVAGIVLFIFFRSNPSTVTATRTTRLPPAIAATSPFNLPPPDLLRPIPPEEALKENAERPFSGRPDTAAVAFNLQNDEKSRARALECMTQAVYYEAASEGADGQRAVAQVVLNRMRHPGYPASVCGVIYQGSDRPTGCQFTFTCDGSVVRIPVPSLWKQAQKIASEALAGKVFPPVGHATHYHADYVLPFWADSLDKSVKVGRHIFYRLKGGLGSPRAFSQRYSGSEPEPPSPSSVQVALDAVGITNPMLNIPTEDAGLQAQAPTGDLIPPPAPPEQKLLADATRGTLVLDGDSPGLPASTERTPEKKPEACGDATQDKRFRPLSPRDMHASGGGC